MPLTGQVVHIVKTKKPLNTRSCLRVVQRLFHNGFSWSPS